MAPFDFLLQALQYPKSQYDPIQNRPLAPKAAHAKATSEVFGRRLQNRADFRSSDGAMGEMTRIISNHVIEATRESGPWLVSK